MSSEDEYTVGETVIVATEVRERGGQLKDPSVSIKLTAKDMDGGSLVADEAMTKDSEGKYSYPYTITAGDPTGLCNTEVIVKNSSPVKVTIDPNTFTIIARTT